MPLREALHQTEKELIDQALIETEGNILQAAKMLDIPRQTLQYKLSSTTKPPNNRRFCVFAPIKERLHI